jgi:DNA-binding helix-hairpin-helix protein with protein kinase domain
MRLRRESNGKVVDLDRSTYLDRGGEGEVHRVGKDLVAKVYHNPTGEAGRKLAAMAAAPPDDPMRAEGHTSIAWPVDLLRTDDGDARTVGFLMPFVAGGASLDKLYVPKSRRQHYPLFNPLYLHRTAWNVAAAVAAVHARGYVVGDLNESNIKVADTALVTLVDTDSFQVRDPATGVVYRCPVGKPEFTPPELRGVSLRDVDRAPESDRFGLAVLIFQLLMEGTHPFAGAYKGVGDPPPIEARIAAGHFPHAPSAGAPYSPMPAAPPFEILHPGLQALFARCFVDGHRNPAARPEAAEWLAALEAAEDMAVCRGNEQHYYAKHLAACPWCERAARLGGHDPFPSRATVKAGKHLPAIQPKQRALPPVANPAPPTSASPRPGVATAPAVAAPSPARVPVRARRSSPDRGRRILLGGAIATAVALAFVWITARISPVPVRPATTHSSAYSPAAAEQPHHSAAAKHHYAMLTASRRSARARAAHVTVRAARHPLHAAHTASAPHPDDTDLHAQSSIGSDNGAGSQGVDASVGLH